MSAFRAELIKLCTLWSIWLAAAIGIIAPAAIAYLNRGTVANFGRSVDDGFYELAFAVTAALIVGVLSVSSEFATSANHGSGSLQLQTSLLAVNSRRRLWLAKLAAVSLVTLMLAIVSSAVTLMISRMPVAGLTEDPPALANLLPRVAGVVLYWVLAALIAAAITLLTRHGAIALTLLVVNSSLVSVSLLLTNVTSLAVLLPDLAGSAMFIANAELPLHLAPWQGGLVMAIWAAGLLAISTTVFTRRDTA